MLEHLHVFADAHQQYLDAGWSGVLALPAGAKGPPPTGYTGTDGRWPTGDVLARWARDTPGGNIGLRMPRDVIGLDLDLYRNADARRDLERLTGPLPPTWCSTSKVDGSGIRFYRVPVLAAGQVWTSGGAGWDVIQHRHRYAVVWPSVHPDGGMYRWVDEASGEIADRVPEIDDLTDLPWQAIEALTVTKDAATARAPIELDLPAGDMTYAVEQRLGLAIADTRGAKGSRHDAALRAVTALVRLAERGETGVPQALDKLRDAFVAAVGPDRTKAHVSAEREYDDMIASARRVVASTVGRIPTRAERDAEWQRVAELTVVRNVDKGTASATHSDTPEWAEPLPLSETTDLPPFPVDALPAWIADHVRGVADELQAPADLPATLALATLALVTAKRARLAILGTWTEPANLYLVVAMPPGSGKSPAFKAMTGVVREHERELAGAAASVIAHAEQRRRIADKAMRKAEDKGDTHEAARLLDELAAESVPPAPRLVLDDATPEALVKVLGEQGGRLAILSTEGGLFDDMTGRYSEKSNLDPYLKAWSGDTIIVDRVNRDHAIVERPALTIGLTVQPSVLAALAARPELAGRGLTARFMYAMPDDVVGRRNMIDPPIADPAIAERYGARITAIAKDVPLVTPVTLQLDPEARRMFLEWRQALEDRRGPYGDLRPMAEWTTKLESSVARLALLLHVADHGYEGDVDTDTMRRALDVGAYWIEHARAVHDLWMLDPVKANALAVLGWIKQRRVDAFTVREAHRALGRRFPKAADLLEPLEALVERGWIAPDGEGPIELGRGGKASPRFVVNPATFLRDTSKVGAVSAVSAVSLEIEKNLPSSSSLRERAPEPVDTADTADTAPTTPHELDYATAPIGELL